MTGILKDRMIKFAPLASVQHREASVSTRSGDDPNPIEIDDCAEVYGDNVIALFPEVKTICHHPARYPSDCIYDATAKGEEYRRCVYCGRMTG